MKEKNGKNIYCMSFKWMQTPEVKKELQVVEQEAGIQLVTRPFCRNKNRYTECAWNIINNYDEYGFPPVHKLEAFAQGGNNVYGCGPRILYYGTEKVDEWGNPFVGVLYYWKNVCADQYRSHDVDIEVTVENETWEAIPYDVSLADSRGKEIGKVRLWEAESKEKYDWENDFSIYAGEAVEKLKRLMRPEKIKEELLFPQQYMEGKADCLGQKYFMVSATVQWAVKKHMEQYGSIYNFQEKNEFLLCDEWSGLAVLELVRILWKEYGFDKKDAWTLAEQVCVYEVENPEKNLLELWPEEIMSRMIPEIYQILIEKNTEEIMGKNLEG